MGRHHCRTKSQCAERGCPTPITGLTTEQHRKKPSQLRQAAHDSQVDRGAALSTPRQNIHLFVTLMSRRRARLVKKIPNIHIFQTKTFQQKRRKTSDIRRIRGFPLHIFCHGKNRKTGCTPSCLLPRLTLQGVKKPRRMQNCIRRGQASSFNPPPANP